MKLEKIGIVMIVLLTSIFVILAPSLAKANVLEGVPQIGQEKSNWCWAACTQSVLAYSETTVAQCNLAIYACEQQEPTWCDPDPCDCCASPFPSCCDSINYLYDPFPGSIQDLLYTFGSKLISVGLLWQLYVAEIREEIIIHKRPFIFRWQWKDGGGHFLVGRGIRCDEDNTVCYMDPMPVGAGGIHWASYDWVVMDEDSIHTWERSLVMRRSVPVMLASFQATSGQGFIALNWTTASEVNCHRWEIHRTKREDGEYAKIGELPGHGSTETEHPYQWVDRQVHPEVTYFYKLRQVDFDGSEWWSHSVSATAAAYLPKAYALHQNYPNPFNPATEITYAIPKDMHVTLKVYNVLGAEVATLVDAHQQTNFYTVRWDADGLASGVYFCRLQAGEFSKTIKMILLK